MLIALMGTAVGLAVVPMVSESLATMLMSGNRMSGDSYGWTLRLMRGCSDLLR